MSWRRTGCMVISQTIAGSKHASSIPRSARSARYSGNERPAWRMNHTGRRDGDCPFAAANKGFTTAIPLTATTVPYRLSRPARLPRRKPGAAYV
ncbi:hypothetical protein GCM10010528_28620 [Gordonia defluvii]|uniref:Uncharacterized protein n=1 Tax=Gordonia defluvii TaxID=283718 RepID=A0ABP6LLI3_9ACTN